MFMYKILMIDDDVEYLDVVCDYISEGEFQVTKALSAKEGLELEKANDYDLIIIDLFLGNVRGTQVAELIRKHNEKSYIVIMTNSVNDEDEINSLQIGIDEYIRKNTSLSVTLHRIKNVLSRQKANVAGSTVLISNLAKIKVDTENKMTYKDNEFVNITALEQELVCYFLKNKNQLLTREQILEDVWLVKGDGGFIDSRTIDVHVKNIRKKLNVKNIQSIRGVGYRWYEK